MRQCFLGLGSNVEPIKNLRAGLEALSTGFGELTVSPVYRSRAFGFDGADFLNLVVGLRTSLPPQQLFKRLRAIEHAHGRPARAQKYADRQLDIDLLLCGELTCDRPPLPRPDILQHDFVLAPLVDLAPQLRHPVTGQCLSSHWEEHRQRHGCQLLRQPDLNPQSLADADLPG